MSGRSRHAAGFTLIELMIVVAIIGILASVAMNGYRAYTNSAQQAIVQHHFRDAVRFARSKAASIHSFQGNMPQGMLPQTAEDWIREINPYAITAARGGPAYVLGTGNPDTGAIGIETEGEFGLGTAVLRIHRPAFGALDAEVAVVPVAMW